jgi:ubiquinone/menaquinone biosynthesis C-methylase UbiE
VTERSLVKRLVGGIYSAVADNLYEPIVVQGAFRLFGANLHETIRVRGRRAADLAAGEPILDMPVGTGYFTLPVAQQHSGIVVGVDLAEGMLRESRRVALEAGVDNLELVRADAHRLPFADGSFAVVMCWNGLQVIPGTDESIAELARVLRPGGTLFASVLTLPVAVSARAQRRLPPMLQSRERFARSFRDAGLTVEATEADRLATIFTATR